MDHTDLTGREYLTLYHPSRTEIKSPDIRYGRKNADFGQGFYLTPDKEFACRWARNDAVINASLIIIGTIEYDLLREKTEAVFRFHIFRWLTQKNM